MNKEVTSEAMLAAWFMVGIAIVGLAFFEVWLLQQAWNRVIAEATSANSISLFQAFILEFAVVTHLLIVRILTKRSP